MLKLYNTLSRKKENFKPLKKGKVGLYTCGPTVYGPAHIGNLRTYVSNDVLRRSLEYLGHKVSHVMNITDVGHLVGDRDMGDDKVEQEAKKKRISAKKLTQKYTKEFLEDIEKLNILKAHELPKATAFIKEQIDFVKLLEKKGYTYQTSDGVYFDTSRFKEYGKLAKLDLKGLKEGARVEKNPEKKNPTDFALWKFTKKGQKRQMEWKSPWGAHSFPGWHVECSVLSHKFLGQPFDIHTGGVDHIPTHHTNEIAQSKAAYGKPLANYWIHGEHLRVDGEKMAKSKKNFYTLKDLVKRDFMSLSFRYLVLGAHYKSKVNFTWSALSSAENGLWNLYRELGRLKFLASKEKVKGSKKVQKEFDAKFKEAVENDLDIPGAMSVMRQVITNQDMSPEQKRELVFKMDDVFGLNLKYSDELYKIPVHIKSLVKGRELLRHNQQFVKGDTLRKKVESLGYEIEDTSYGPFIWPSKHQKFHPKT